MLFFSVGDQTLNINGGIDNPNLTLGENDSITVANPDRNNVLWKMGKKVTFDKVGFIRSKNSI